MSLKLYRLSGLFFVFTSVASAAESGLFAASEQPLALLAPFSEIAARASSLRKISEFARVTDGSFAIDSVESDPGMRTTKAQYRIGGIPVIGAMISLHRSQFGVETVTSSLPRPAAPSLVPNVSAAEALKIASLLSTNPLAKPAELKLLANRDRTALELVWWISTRSLGVENPGSDIIVGAVDGRVKGEISQMHTAETVVYNARESGLMMKLVGDPGVTLKSKVFKRREGFVPEYLLPAIRPAAPQLKGCIVTDMATGKEFDLAPEECLATVKGTNENGAKACQIINADDGSVFMLRPENCELHSTDGRITGTPNRSADHAMDNARTVYDYYSNRFGRRSFDGKGTVLRSVVQAGKGWSNAAWMGDLNFMVYGNGDGKVMGDFTQLLDVAGHEMTHGVVNSTARLAMMDEPGALNEATADYFGLQISRYNDWQIGVGLYLGKPKDALRSIWNPGMYSDTYLNDAGEKVTKPNPAKYSDRYPVTAATECGRTNDRCFVHMNSTIMSHGYYQIHHRLGKSKTQDLIFRALTQYYRTDTNLHEAANLLRRACTELYDDGTCAKVDEALRIVEL